jgi:hypothetical protein
MTNFDKMRLAVARRQAKALERIADALAREPEMEPVEEIELEGVITWQDAIHVMKHTCIEADECGPGCPMNAWCQTFNKEGSAPAKWEPIENDEEAEE